jgi:lambda family phage minor tail protein L
MTLEADLQQGWHDAIVELIDLDLSPITNDPADIFYFTNQVKPDDTKIQWKGNIYEPIPIASAGYEKSTTGQIAQPSLTVANVLGTFTQVISELDDLVGAKVTRRRTLGKYLDGEPGADPLQEFPIDVFYIERKVQENSMIISWELASVLDLEGLKLPRRIITQNYCQWRYRGSECGYTGGILYGSNDKPIDTTGLSAAAVTVVNASLLVERRERERVDAINARNAAIGNRNQQCEQFVFLESRFSLSPGGEGLFYVSSVFLRTVARAAYWGNQLVTLGTVYRQGRRRAFAGFLFLGIFFEIERWGVDAGACSTATAQLVTAEANLVTAENNLTAAQVALAAANAALPLNDPLRLLDVCGKRVDSCKLRFSYTSLPFGGFPGANTVRQ